MTASAADHHAPSAGPRPPDRVRAFVYAGCFLALAALGFLFVTGQSFWLDEVRNGAKAVQPTFAAFLSKLFQMGGTEVQSPLHIILLWAWGRLAGTSEWTLRSINVAFLAVALAVVSTERTLSRPLRLWWGLLCVLSPLVAFYLDEVRPWLLVFAGGTSIAAALARANAADFPSRSQTWRLLGGIVVLSAASMTGAVFAAWTGLWFLFETIRNRTLRPLLRRQPAAFATAAAALVLLAAYYLWTVLAGYQGTRANPTTLFSTGFCLYEFLGFAGIGPGRAALRADWTVALSGSLFTVIAFAAVWLCFAAAVRRSGRLPVRRITAHPLFLCPLLGVATLLAAGAIAHERILARHLMSALPALLLALAWALDRVWRSGRLGRAAALALCAAFLVSSLSLRFAPRHAKDDVRSAARLAREAAEAGSVVWWGGDKWTFEYYPPPAGAAASRLLLFPDSAETPLPRPALAVLSSKYDISDPSGSRRILLRSLGLFPDPFSSPRGFVLWTPAPAEPEL